MSGGFDSKYYVWLERQLYGRAVNKSFYEGLELAFTLMNAREVKDAAKKEFAKYFRRVNPSELKLIDFSKMRGGDYRAYKAKCAEVEVGDTDKEICVAWFEDGKLSTYCELWDVAGWLVVFKAIGIAKFQCGDEGGV